MLMPEDIKTWEDQEQFCREVIDRTCKKRPYVKRMVELLAQIDDDPTMIDGILGRVLDDRDNTDDFYEMLAFLKPMTI